MQDVSWVMEQRAGWGGQGSGDHHGDDGGDDHNKDGDEGGDDDDGDNTVDDDNDGDKDDMVMMVVMMMLIPGTFVPWAGFLTSLSLKFSTTAWRHKATLPKSLRITWLEVKVGPPT